MRVLRFAAGLGLVLGVLAGQASLGADPFSDSAIPDPPELALTGTLAEPDLKALIKHGEALFSASPSASDIVVR